MKKRIAPNIYFLGLLAISVFLRGAFPKAIIYPYSMIGIIPVIAGISMVFATNFLLSKKKTSTEPYGSPSLLVTSGLFRITRNPIYLGMTIILLGAEIILGSLPLLFLPVIFVVAIDRFVIPVEEENLERVFGIKYTDYKKRVRRWI